MAIAARPDLDLRAHTPDPAVDDRQIDVREVIGGAAFARLPEMVQARFGRHGPHHAPIVYRGMMEKVEASRLGRLIAFAARLIGNPVVVARGRNVPCTVTLYPDDKLGGTVWHRCYGFADGHEVAATTKRRGDDGGAIESFSGLFGMPLDIREVTGELHFITDSYFAEWRGWRLTLPRWLSPGRLTVVHRDEEDGWFRFIMTLEHPLLGVLLHQDGVFYDPEDEL